MVLIDAHGNHPNFFTVEENRQKLQRVFAPHFEGLDIVPRQRAHRLPAIVTDFEKRTIDLQHLSSLTANPRNAKLSLQIASECVDDLLIFVSGYAMKDALPDHSARWSIKTNLMNARRSSYFVYKAVNQLSGNKLGMLPGSLLNLSDELIDLGMQTKITGINNKIKGAIINGINWDKIPLDEKLQKVRYIVDLCFDGLEVLSEGLPPKDEVVFVT